MLRLLRTSAIALFIAAIAGATSWATTRYISTTGSDSGSCTVGSPCATYSYAKGISSAGDDFEFAGGTYTAAGNSITGFSGVNSSNPTEIRCSTPLYCTIKNASPVDITGATYHDIKLGGFFLWSTGSNSSLAIESPDATALASQTYNIEVSTCFGYVGAHSNQNSVGWSIARISSSTFINVGSIGNRYAILVYGCYKINMWRSLISLENNWTPTSGNPSGGLAIYDTQDSTFTHIFVHDTQYGTDADILDKLGIYVPGNSNGTTSQFTTSARDRIYSSLVLNNNQGHCFGEEGGSGGNNSDIRLINTALLGCDGVAITIANKSTNFRAENVTASSAPWNNHGSDTTMLYGAGAGNSVTGSVITQSNLAFGSQDGINGSWTNTNTNVYSMAGSAYSGGASAGSGDTATNPAFVHAIISTSTAVSPKGADLRFEYDYQGGVTSTKLWHWPYECTIKDWYKRTIGVSHGVFATNYTYTQWAFRWIYGNTPPSGYNSTGTEGVAYSDSEYGAGGGGGSPAAYTSTPTVISRGDLGVYIMNFNLYDSSATWINEVAIARQMGAGVIRSNWDVMDVIWQSTNVWSWGYMDWVADLLRANGLKMYWTAPWRATWMAPHGSCQGTNPYAGTGTPSTTQCPAADASLPAIYVSSFVARYQDVIHTVEIPSNEPELLSASTDVAHHANIAARDAKAALDVNPNIRIAFPALSTPKLTLLNGGLTAGATTFRDHHYLAQFYNQFSSSLSYVGHGVTMSSFSTSIHPYFDAAGGNQTFQLCMTTISAIAGNYSNNTPVIDFTEVGAFGGSASGAVNVWETNKSSAIIRAFAIMKSTNSAWSGLGGVFIIHNLAGYDFSATTTSYVKRPLFGVTKRLYELGGFLPLGDQGDGSNVRKYKFVQGNRTVWIVWTESGTSSWSLNPTYQVSVTDVTGLTQLYPKSAFSPYTITTSPIIVEEITNSRVGGGTANRGRIR